MFPLVDGGIFQVEHDPGRAGIKHFHHQLGIVRRAGHLIALVVAPFGQLDVPAVPHRVAGITVYRFVSQWDSASTTWRSSISSLRRAENLWCRGLRNSKKPSGKSRSALK